MGLQHCTLRTCPTSIAFYGYRPSLVFNVLFVGIAAVCLLAGIAITVKSRRGMRRYLAYGILFAEACLLEVVAYSERLRGWQNPWDLTHFMVGTVFSTVAPAFLTSGIYILVSEVIRLLGREHSPVRSSLLVQLLVPLDVISLLLQGFGLTVMFADATPDDGLGPKSVPGRFAILAGLALQTVSLATAITVLFTVYSRARRAIFRFGYPTYHPRHGYVPITWRFKVFMVVLPVVALSVLGRCAFRIVGYAQGFSSQGIFANETLYIICEGELIAVALLGLTMFHPSIWLESGKPKRQIADMGERGVDAKDAKYAGVSTHEEGDVDPAPAYLETLRGTSLERPSPRSPPGSERNPFSAESLPTPLSPRRKSWKGESSGEETPLAMPLEPMRDEDEADSDHGGNEVDNDDDDVCDIYVASPGYSPESSPAEEGGDWEVYFPRRDKDRDSEYEGYVVIEL